MDVPGQLLSGDAQIGSSPVVMTASQQVRRFAHSRSPFSPGPSLSCKLGSPLQGHCRRSSPFALITEPPACTSIHYHALLILTFFTSSPLRNPSPRPPGLLSLPATTTPESLLLTSSHPSSTHSLIQNSRSYPVIPPNVPGPTHPPSCCSPRLHRLCGRARGNWQSARLAIRRRRR